MGYFVAFLKPEAGEMYRGYKWLLLKYVLWIFQQYKQTARHDKITTGPWYALVT